MKAALWVSKWLFFFPFSYKYHWLWNEELCLTATGVEIRGAREAQAHWVRL